ncbi:MAG: hypothetical protein ACJ8F1_06255, partial [Polyangia bacterium]
MARPRLLLLAGLALAWPAVARADKYDLNLYHLCPPSADGGCSWVQTGANGQKTVTLDPEAASRYRSL